MNEYLYSVYVLLLPVPQAGIIYSVSPVDMNQYDTKKITQNNFERANLS